MVRKKVIDKEWAKKLFDEGKIGWFRSINSSDFKSWDGWVQVYFDPELYYKEYLSYTEEGDWYVRTTLEHWYPEGYPEPTSDFLSLTESQRRRYGSLLFDALYNNGDHDLDKVNEDKKGLRRFSPRTQWGYQADIRIPLSPKAYMFYEQDSTDSRTTLLGAWFEMRSILGLTDEKTLIDNWREIAIITYGDKAHLHVPRLYTTWQDIITYGILNFAQFFTDMRKTTQIINHGIQTEPALKKLKEEGVEQNFASTIAQLDYVIWLLKMATNKQVEVIRAEREQRYRTMVKAIPNVDSEAILVELDRHWWGAGHYNMANYPNCQCRVP